MKKLKLISSLSLFGIIGVSTPLIVTACDEPTNFHFDYHLENEGKVAPGNNLVITDIILYEDDKEYDEYVRTGYKITNTNGEDFWSTKDKDNKISEEDFEDNTLTLKVGSEVPKGIYHYYAEARYDCSGIATKLTSLEFDFEVV